MSSRFTSIATDLLILRWIEKRANIFETKHFPRNGSRDENTDWKGESVVSKLEL